MAVEVRSVDTGELHFAADADTAGSAHAGAVDHDRVERHHGLHAVGPRRLDAGVHHRQRTDGDDQIRLVALEHLLQRGGDEARRTVAAVVGADDQFVAELVEPILPEHEILVAKADDAGGAIAGLLERAQLRIYRRHAEPAADQHYVPDLAHVLRHAERADEIGEAVALLVMIPHLERGLAERLDHHGDGAFVAIEIGHRQRDAFAALVHAHHDEMAGLGRSGYVRSHHFPEKSRIGKNFAADDRVHREEPGGY